MPRYDLCLSGGSALVAGIGLTEADILVHEGKIAALIQPGAHEDAAEVVRIPGLTVLPGAIDSHIHLGHGKDITMPREANDATLESSAAASGGVTTMIPYLMSVEPYENFHEKLVGIVESGSLVDFAFHFVICTDDQMNAISTYVEKCGVPTFKLFMNFRGDEGKYLNIPGNDDGFLFRLLEKLAQNGAMICPHPENIEIVWVLRERTKNMDLPPLRAWNETRPDYVEAEALMRAAYFARLKNVPLNSVHTSSAEAIAVVEMQRAANGTIYLETCPHYLTHDFDSELGSVGKVNPPLRPASDRQALWKALEDGVIDTVASDHVARPKSAKEGDIWKAAAGFPGMETLLPIMLSEGHRKRGIPLERIMDTVSRNPARIQGLYPRKGAIGVGFDADFAIVDLKDGYTMTSKDVHSGAGYSLYEGWRIECKIVHTLVRGVFAKKDGQVQNIAGHGRFLPRKLNGNLQHGGA